jgi:cephalosporin hydroxylase
VSNLERRLDAPIKDLLVLQQNRILHKSKYFGIPTLKNPLDMWIYQELIWKNKPNVIIEIGTYMGGSALAMAHWLDQIGNGIVISIDINLENVSSAVWNHPRIKLIKGDANDTNTIKKVLNFYPEKAMVIEDSSHEYQQTLDILENYAPIVTSGQYFIVEDTICGHGLNEGPRPGPMEAVMDFVKNHDEFEIDRECESFLTTWNSNGYLKCK